MDLLLAADTTTAFLSIGLCSRDDSGVRLLGEITLNAGRRHAETLLPSTNWLLAQCGHTLEEVDLLAVTTGPGSFTGLRIGVAAWKGLAYALDRPLIAVPTLDALASLHPWESDTVCVMLDARMSEVFYATYRFDQGARTQLVPASVAPPEAAIADLPGNAVFCGDGALRYAELIRAQYPDARILPEPACAPRAAALACEAYSLYDAGGPVDAARVEPLYLRKTQAEVNRDLKEASAREA